MYIGPRLPKYYLFIKSCLYSLSLSLSLLIACIPLNWYSADFIFIFIILARTAVYIYTLADCTRMPTHKSTRSCCTVGVGRWTCRCDVSWN